MRVKFLAMAVLILFVFFPAYAEGAVELPQLKLKLDGNKISLAQGYNVYSYPSGKGEFSGIKKVWEEDITGDGEKEYILAVQLEGGGSPAKFPYGVILICRRKNNDLDIQYQLITGSHSPDFELVDVNKDGIKDVIARGFNFPRWLHLKIVSWQDGEYVLLWNEGDDDNIISQIFEINDNGDAQIKVGVPSYYYSTGATYWYNKEKWETWVWDGKGFVLEE